MDSSSSEQAEAWRHLAEALNGAPAAPLGEVPQHLEAAVASRFDEADTWRVLADWLLERGHAFGHVIAAEARGASEPAGRALVSSALGEGSAITWAHGVITELRLAPPAVNEQQPLHALLRRVLEHPCGRFLRKLQVVLPPYPSLKVERKHAADAQLLADALTAGRLPFLTELELRPSRAPLLENVARRKSDVSSAESIAPLLEGSALPGLERLRLTHSEWNVGLLEKLAPSKVLVRLAELDLSFGLLGSGAVKVLKAHSSAFAHLQRLVLTGNYFSAAELAALKRSLPRIEAGEQRTFDLTRARYSSAGE